MQIRSRDSIPPKYRRKSLNKNGNSLQKEGLNRIGTGQVLMIMLETLPTMTTMQTKGLKLAMLLQNKVARWM